MRPSDLPAIPITPKTGDESLVTSKATLPFNLLAFWQWTCSNLVSNATRGVLAEFLVAKALDLEIDIRNEWGNYDIEIEGAIQAGTVTYDLERLMDGATKVSCSGFGDAIIDNM